LILGYICNNEDEDEGDDMLMIILYVEGITEIQGGTEKSGPFYFVAYNMHTTLILNISTTYLQDLKQ